VTGSSSSNTPPSSSSTQSSSAASSSSIGEEIWKKFCDAYHVVETYENFENVKKDTLGIAQLRSKDGKRAKPGDEISILLSDGTTRLTTITSGGERPFPDCRAGHYIRLGAVGDYDLSKGNYSSGVAVVPGEITACPGDEFAPCAEDLTYSR
jgi:hypothetical protein